MLWKSKIFHNQPSPKRGAPSAESTDLLASSLGLLLGEPGEKLVDISDYGKRSLELIMGSRPYARRDM